MPHAALMAVALVLDATTGHQRHGFIGLVLLLVIIAGVAYYFWRRRQAQRERDK